MIRNFPVKKRGHIKNKIRILTRSGWMKKKLNISVFGFKFLNRVDK